MKGRYEGVDIVTVRENTEDLYAGIEHMVGEDAAESIKLITRKGSERIVRYAFDYAVKNGRKKVTAVHKANIMKCTDGLFLDVARAVAAEYPQIEFEDKIVDATCMQLVQKPEAFDVMVLPNLYGDIVSDLCAGLVGGLGLAPSANIGKDCAIFEAVHGSAPKHAWLNDANPTALILSAVMLLRHIGETEAAEQNRERRPCPDSRRHDHPRPGRQPGHGRICRRSHRKNVLQGLRRCAILFRHCGCSSMAEHQLPKLNTRVRFPSPAPWQAGLLPGLPLFSAFSCLELGGAEGHNYCGKIQRTRW